MEILKDDLIQAMKQELVDNTLYVLIAEQYVAGNTQTFFLGFDAGRPHLYRDYYRASIFHYGAQDFIFLGEQLVKAVEERTHEDFGNPFQYRNYAYHRGEWKLSFIPLELNQSKAISGFMIGYEEDASHFNTEASNNINITSCSSVKNITANAPTPDLVNDHISVTADELIHAISTKEWQLVDKIRGTGQHSIRQKKNRLVYSYSFRGRFNPGEVMRFHNECISKGWVMIGVIEKGIGSCIWTIVELSR